MDWKQPAAVAQATGRKIYPFEFEAIPDALLLGEFDKYMVAVKLARTTRKIYEQGLTRFMMMFETTDGSPVDFSNLVLNIARSDLFELLPALEIMSPAHSWAWRMVTAVSHFTTMQKLRFKAEANNLGADLADSIIGAYLEPWRKSLKAA